MRCLADSADPLGDVLGEIADPFKIAGHADRADDGAQILRHGLALGDQGDRAVVQIALMGVHDSVLGDHALTLGGIALQQGADRRRNHRACRVAHLADQAVDLVEFGVE